MHLPLCLGSYHGDGYRFTDEAERLLLTTVLAGVVAGLIIALNTFLLYQTFFGGR
jgi:Mn2+/Fe2+ NRAMP family transporter